MESGPHGEERAEELFRELSMRGQFYFKDCGIVLSSLLSSLEIYVTAERTAKYEQYIRNALGKLKALYQGIPFDSITGHPDYDLLLRIRAAIFSLGPLVDAVLAGGTDIEAAEAIITSINDLGQEYRSRLIAIQTMLREEPGHEYDGLVATSVIDGKVWDKALG